MRNFVIFIEGENFNLELEGASRPVGFFASRRIEAETEAEASSAVLALLLSEPEIAGKALPGHTVFVRMVHEMPLAHKNEYHGFTFFPMEE